MMRAMRAHRLFPARLALPVLALAALSLTALASASAMAQKPRDFERPVAMETSPSAIPQDNGISADIREELDLERTLPFLAYTLGELHYLAFSCDSPDDQQWRQQMVELLAMEAADNGRWRDRLIQSFNDGYRAQQRYRTRCGLEADAERRALAHRGRDLSEMMRAAYFD